MEDKGGWLTCSDICRFLFLHLHMCTCSCSHHTTTGLVGTACHCTHRNLQNYQDIYNNAYMKWNHMYSFVRHLIIWQIFSNGLCNLHIHWIDPHRQFRDIWLQRYIVMETYFLAHWVWFSVPQSQGCEGWIYTRGPDSTGCLDPV